MPLDIRVLAADPRCCANDCPQKAANKIGIVGCKAYKVRLMGSEVTKTRCKECMETPIKNLQKSP